MSARLHSVIPIGDSLCDWENRVFSECEPYVQFTTPPDTRRQKSRRVASARVDWVLGAVHIIYNDIIV